MYSGTYVREAQPDWLTVGAHKRSTVEAQRDLARALGDLEQHDGNQHRPWRLLGYEGFRCGRVRYGEARGWGLMQLSGDMAASHLDAALEHADSVSRFDLAVTIQTDKPDPDLGRRLYDAATAWRADHRKAAKAWFIGGDESGWTTYIGRRSSDFFFRCYDKGAEACDDGRADLIAQYENAWRYELECKGEPAEAIARQVAEANDPGGTTRALVHGWLTARGVTPRFDCDGDIRPNGSLRRRSDRERKLEWLSTQVLPTVRWLVENGDSPAAIAALGLTDYLQPRFPGA